QVLDAGGRRIAVSAALCRSEAPQALAAALRQLLDAAAAAPGSEPEACAKGQVSFAHASGSDPGAAAGSGIRISSDNHFALCYKAPLGSGPLSNNSWRRTNGRRCSGPVSTRPSMGVCG